MTISEYLRGLIAFDISDANVASVMYDRGVQDKEYVEDLTEREKDLCKADVYVFAATSPSTKGSVEDVNGVWKHKEGGSTMAGGEAARLIYLANRLYRKWGEPMYGSGIRIQSQGMRWTSAR